MSPRDMKKEHAEAKSKLLTKEDILAARDSKIERVETPEWGGHVFVRSMTGEERDRYEASIVEGGKLTRKDIHAKLAAYTICDDNGVRMFSEAEVTELTKKNAAPLHRICRVAKQLSGILPEIEELVAILKNALPASSPTA